MYVPPGRSFRNRHKIPAMPSPATWTVGMCGDGAPWAWGEQGPTDGISKHFMELLVAAADWLTLAGSTSFSQCGRVHAICHTLGLLGTSLRPLTKPP